MTVIDVNTGKAEKKTKEDVIKKVNFEAADEIRRQLILRNKGTDVVAIFTCPLPPEDNACELRLRL